MVQEGLYLEELDLSSIKPGQRVELLIYLPRAISESEVAQVESTLASQIELTSPVQFNSSDNTLRIEFKTPEGVGAVWFIPIAIIGALAAIGMSAYMGYKLTELFTKPTFVIGALLIVGLIYVASKYVGKRA